MVRRLLSSQLRINMASGVVTTVINTAVMLISYPIYLHYLGYEKMAVWMVLATVLTFYFCPWIPGRLPRAFPPMAHSLQRMNCSPERMTRGVERTTRRAR